jgi:7tm Chemosensory receptor
LIPLTALFFGGFWPFVNHFFSSKSRISAGTFTYFLAIFLRHTFFAQFIIATAAVRCRFEALNHKLEFGKAFAFKQLSTVKIGKVFHCLCDCIDIINRTCTFHFILMVANILAICVFASYGLIIEIMRSQSFSVITAILNVNTIAFHLMFLGLIIRAGSKLTKEAEKTIVIISKISNEASLQTDFMCLLASIKCRDLRIQNDVFVINWKVLLVVSGSRIFWVE